MLRLQRTPPFLKPTSNHGEELQAGNLSPPFLCIIFYSMAALSMFGCYNISNKLTYLSRPSHACEYHLYIQPKKLTLSLSINGSAMSSAPYYISAKRALAVLH